MTCRKCYLAGGPFHMKFLLYTNKYCGTLHSFALAKTRFPLGCSYNKCKFNFIPYNYFLSNQTILLYNWWNIYYLWRYLKQTSEFYWSVVILSQTDIRILLILCDTTWDIRIVLIYCDTISDIRILLIYRFILKHTISSFPPLRKIISKWRNIGWNHRSIPTM